MALFARLFLESLLHAGLDTRRCQTALLVAPWMPALDKQMCGKEQLT